jgi:hypothetical protein
MNLILTRELISSETGDGGAGGKVGGRDFLEPEPVVLHKRGKARRRQEWMEGMKEGKGLEIRYC